MKYFSRILLNISLAFCLSSCTDILVQEIPEAGEVPVRITFSMADKAVQTKSMVSGTETVVQVMQLVCFDAEGKYLGIRNAEVTSNGASGTFYDTGVIKGSVPQNTARIHFIANRSLGVPLISHSVGESESAVMNSAELSTAYDEDNDDHRKVCYWGYHMEASAEAMNEWLNPAEDSHHTVYLIRDRAKVVLTYDPTGATIPVTKVEWLIHNGRKRGFLAPAEENWSNDGYYGNAQIGSGLVSTASMHEYSNEGRYSLWTSEDVNEEDNFDVTYQAGTNLSVPQYLFDDVNSDLEPVKAILRVTYNDNGTTKVVYHVLLLNDDDKVKYRVVRNNTYYIKCKLLSPDVAFFETLEDAINGTEFMNADVEIERSITDVNDDQYTLQILLPTETTAIVLNTPGDHHLDFAFRMANDVSQAGSEDPDDFDVYWEYEQNFCSDPTLEYNSETMQFEIHTTVDAEKLNGRLNDQWIVVKHKTSGLTRYIHVFVIDQFRYRINPTLTAVSGTNDYVLSFQIPPIEHERFIIDEGGNRIPDPDELVYPQSLYPIDVKFATNTLNPYALTQGGSDYGLFGVSVSGTSVLCDSSKFEPNYNIPVSTTSTLDNTHWYYQQAFNYWDFWYDYSIKEYPDDGHVNIYLHDVRDKINYATVTDVGLFLFVEYFGKNYSVPVSN